MMANAEWRYDAIEGDPLIKLRIPVVGNAWPRWNYIVAFDLDYIDGATLRPTDAEARLIQSYNDFYNHEWYNATWVKKMRERPFDIDGGANGIVFRKWATGDWGYRRQSWRYGPCFVPQHPRIRARETREAWAIGPMTLAEVLDMINGYGDDPNPKWEAWKRARPEVFGRPS